MSTYLSRSAVIAAHGLVVGAVGSGGSVGASGSCGRSVGGSLCSSSATILEVMWRASDTIDQAPTVDNVVRLSLYESITWGSGQVGLGSSSSGLDGCAYQSPMN